MPDTIESDFSSEPAATTAPPPGTMTSHHEENEATTPGLAIPDIMPLLDVAEGRMEFMMSVGESALRSTMLVSAAGLECGTIWSRGWWEINAQAATSAWRASQTSIAASSDLLDRWMDVQVQALDATAARLAKAA